MLQSYENNLSNVIENYINDLFDDSDGEIINLRRKDLAEMFDCVPSQINYVLRSRFSPERGFLIESRRGEYGYIRIFRVSLNRSDEKINHLSELIGYQISFRDACRLLEALRERGLISNRERLLIEIALKDLSGSHRRASGNTAALLKKMLFSLIADDENKLSEIENEFEFEDEN